MKENRIENYLPSSTSKEGCAKVSLLRMVPIKGYFSFFRYLEIRLNLAVIERLNRRTPFILFINNFTQPVHGFIDRLMPRASLVIFDMSDDFVEYYPTDDTKHRQEYLESLKKFAGASDIVITVNEHLKSKYQYLNNNIHVLKNATNYHNFHRNTYRPVSSLESFKITKSPIIGYVGTIRKNRIDFDLVEFLVQQRTNWKFVFIGKTDMHFETHFKGIPNLHMIPPVNYQDLPDYMQYFDVAIVPFLKNEHTVGNDLLKFYDYLAMCKPVVSTDTGGARNLAHVIKVAENPQHFLQEIENGLAVNGIEEISRRPNVAIENDWKTRIKTLEALTIQAFGSKFTQKNKEVFTADDSDILRQALPEKIYGHQLRKYIIRVRYGWSKIDSNLPEKHYGDSFCLWQNECPRVSACSLSRCSLGEGGSAVKNTSLKKL